jgi:CheY-like chemotaxis protein
VSARTDVLVVDDEAALRTSVADILRAAGYTVLEAADGQAALEVLETEQVVVVVLDQRMPRKSGIDVVKALSSPPAVIMMSAHRIESSDKALINGKVFSYLTKPVPPLRLLQEVAAAYGEGDRP